MTPRGVQALRRWDSAFARFEGQLASGLLLTMIVVASARALSFNLAERGVRIAASALEASAWVDPFLQKATLWLAFLGASLATHEDRHFAVDLATRLVPEPVARIMCRIGAFAAGGIALLLGWAFWGASLASDASIPFEYERLTPSGRVHVCDLPRALLGEAGRPEPLCALRSLLAAVHVPTSSPSGMAQLIAPVMFGVIAARLFGRAVGVLGQAPEPRVEVNSRATAPEASAD